MQAFPRETFTWFIPYRELRPLGRPSTLLARMLRARGLSELAHLQVDFSLAYLLPAAPMQPLAFLLAPLLPSCSLGPSLCIMLPL